MPTYVWLGRDPRMMRRWRRRGYRSIVSTRRTIGVATFALSVVGSAALVATLDGAGVGEFLFFAVLLWFAVTVLRLVIDGGRRAWMEARQARSLASTPPEEVARRAVVEERVRLAADIEAVVRVSVTKMGEHAREAADEWDRDPTDALVGVQDEGRRELRVLDTPGSRMARLDCHGQSYVVRCRGDRSTGGWHYGQPCLV
jgi:hypothetical protein